MADGQVATRPWFVLGFAHLLAAAFLGVAASFSAPFVRGDLHLLVAGAGLFLVAGALAYGFASPFLKREVVGSWPAHAALGLVLAGDVLSTWNARWGALALAVAYVALPLHLTATAVFGPTWRGGVALFAKDQPFRLGDALAASCFALSLVGLVVSAVLHATLPRGIVVQPLAAHVLLFALPFFAGLLVFLLPRNAKRPLPGATLVGVALVLHALAAGTLVLALSVPGLTEHRQPAAGIALALALFLAAMLRLRFPRPLGKQVERARPFLLGAVSLAPLTALATLLALAPNGPTVAFPLGGYATLLLAADLAVAATVLGAPILLNAVPRDGAWWSRGAAALTIAALVLLLSGAEAASIAALAAALLAAWGLAPMRDPRRVCPPD